MGLVVLAGLLVFAVIVFFQANPRGVDPRRLLAYNVAALALCVPLALGVGVSMFADAASLKAGEPGMAAYLGIMAGGATALVAVAVAGLIRNFVVFPRSRRQPPPPQAPG